MNANEQMIAEMSVAVLIITAKCDGVSKVVITRQVAKNAVS